MKYFRVIYQEIFLVLIISIIAVVSTGLLVGFDDLFDTQNVLLNDFYLGVSSGLFMICLLLILTYLIYLPRQILSRFQNNVPNIILLATISWLIISISLVMSNLSIVHSFGNGWIIYPPISATSPDELKFEGNTITRQVRNFLMVLQTVLLLSLVWVSLRTGKKLN